MQPAGVIPSCEAGGAPSGMTVWQTERTRKNSRTMSGRSAPRQAPPSSRVS